MTDSGAAAVAERVARESYGRLVALLAYSIRDISLTEDALADAFERALPGVPEFVGIFGGPARHRPWSERFEVPKCLKSVGTRLVD